MSDDWGCDCGGVVDRRSGVKSHKPACSSHHGRCCDCCQTHVEPHKGCWLVPVGPTKAGE